MHSWIFLEPLFSWLLNIFISSTLICDFRPLAVMSHDLRVISDVFCEVITRKKNIVEEIESIRGAHAEGSSPSWVCIPQKSLAIARDFWNTNSLGWTSFRTGARDGFFLSLPGINGYPIFNWVAVLQRLDIDEIALIWWPLTLGIIVFGFLILLLRADQKAMLQKNSDTLNFLETRMTCHISDQTS